MPFAKSYHLLTHEGHLFRACIANGLSALCKSDLSDKGALYVAFFQLSIGLERLMKLILIIDHMASHNLSPPTYSTIKQYSHELEELFKLLCVRSKASPTDPLAAIVDPSLEFEILAFLHEFASQARYFNINRLASAASTPDPLAKWDSLISKIFFADVPTRTKNRIAAQVTALGPNFNRLVTAAVSDLQGRSLMADGMVTGIAQQRAAAPYAVRRIVSILIPLADLLSEVTSAAQIASMKVLAGQTAIPAMDDFTAFLRLDPRWVLRKRRWP